MSEMNNYSYITIDGNEYLPSKDILRIVLKHFPKWSFGCSNKENSWCILEHMVRSENSGYFVKERFDIPYVCFEQQMYITRETFENEILTRIGDC